MVAFQELAYHQFLKKKLRIFIYVSTDFFFLFLDELERDFLMLDLNYLAVFAKKEPLFSPSIPLNGDGLPLLHCLNTLLTSLKKWRSRNQLYCVKGFVIQ